jgi:hypothetical protein
LAAIAYRGEINIVMGDLGRERSLAPSSSAKKKGHHVTQPFENTHAIWVQKIGHWS